MKKYKYDTRRPTSDFLNQTYRTVNLKTINKHLGKSIKEVQSNWNEEKRTVDKTKYPVETKFVIAISKKTGKYAIQKVLIPKNSFKATNMRKQKQKKQKKQSGDNPNKRYLDGKRKSQQPHEKAYRKRNK